MADIFGDNLDNILAALADADAVYGLGGNDNLTSAFLSTSLFGGEGSDIVRLNYVRTFSQQIAGNIAPWLLDGGAGDDRISANVTINDHLVARPAIEPPIAFMIQADGGTGNDTTTINLNFDSYMGSLEEDWSNAVTLTNQVTDLAGNNRVVIRSHAHTTATVFFAIVLRL